MSVDRGRRRKASVSMASLRATVQNAAMAEVDPSRLRDRRPLDYKEQRQVCYMIALATKGKEGETMMRAKGQYML